MGQRPGGCGYGSRDGYGSIGQPNSNQVRAGPGSVFGTHWVRGRHEFNNLRWLRPGRNKVARLIRVKKEKGEAAI